MPGSRRRTWIGMVSCCLRRGTAKRVRFRSGGIAHARYRGCTCGLSGIRARRSGRAGPDPDYAQLAALTAVAARLRFQRTPQSYDNPTQVEALPLPGADILQSLGAAGAPQKLVKESAGMPTDPRAFSVVPVLGHAVQYFPQQLRL